MRRWLRLLCLACLICASPLLAQSVMERLITPGPLSAPHARLESKCDSCHSSFQKAAQNGKCTACHKGVGSDVATGTRYHGKHGPARSGACKSCHSEHKGKGFGLIQLNRATFNHAFTDYPLTGAHHRAACAGCHGASHNYRGVTRDCASCHARKDPHRGQLGRTCQNCHTTAAWKPVSGFNHAATGFALAGAHRQASCMACHAGQRWKGLATTCVSCHARDDAHRGSRGTNCASCHSTATWKSASFDHASTGFALTGGHAAATCAGCHGVGNANKHPSRACVACHARDDSHKGQNGSDCAACHNPRSWQQTSFDHDRMTAFPLKGAHRSVVCEGCHKQPPKQVKPPATCFGCHAADDSHKGANGMDCGRCHTASAWKLTNFNHATMTRFPLLGKHAAVRCETCHVRPAAEVKLSTDCGSCHAKDDPHAGRLGADCARCHNADGWAGQVRFDHDLSRFPLLGKHAGLACAACHADKSFAAKGTTCAACHQDTHHAGTLGTPAPCQACHNNASWQAWSFDHDKATSFALTGRHKGLICSACHTRPGDPARQGGQCIDCHKRDDAHRGGFGEDCARCHVTSGFSEILIDTNRRSATPRT
jgi:predicted CXXCH cytochrome family protein